MLPYVLLLLFIVILIKAILECLPEAKHPRKLSNLLKSHRSRLSRGSPEANFGTGFKCT